MTTNDILSINRPMKQRLLDFPGLIRAKKVELEAARKVLKDAQTAVQELEAEMVTMIAAEVNPNTGKPAFSNAEARAAELVRRKANDPRYLEASQELQRAEETMNAVQFDLERLYDEFRAYRYVVDLTARELALLAVDSHSESREREQKFAAGNEPY